MNDTPVDMWTLGHALIGYGLGVVGVSFTTAFGLAVTWELIEPILKESYPEYFPHSEQDSSLNKVLDVAAWMTGYWVGA